MAPIDDMSERLDQHDARLDEHGKRLGHIDERLNNQAIRVERHEQLLLGDDQLGLTGLVAQLREISVQLSDLAEWRTQIVGYGNVIITAIKIVIVLLSIDMIRDSLPQLIAWYRTLIGG